MKCLIEDIRENPKKDFSRIFSVEGELYGTLHRAGSKMITIYQKDPTDERITSGFIINIK